MARTPDEMANELEQSDVEVGGQMAEDLMAAEAAKKLGDDDAPATNLQPQPVEQEPAKQVIEQPQPQAAQPESKPVQPEPEPVSFLSGLEDVEDGGEAAETPKPTSVPPGMIRDIQSEREKRKAAEQQAAEYQRKLAEYEAKQQTPVIDLKEILGEGEDDDFVDRKTVAKAIQAATQQAVDQARAAATQEAQQREQAQQAQAAKHQRQQAMTASEAMIRKTVGDYDAVVKQAMELNVLSLDDKRAILSSPNPAGTLYFKAKQVLNAFGIQPTVPTPPAALPAENPKKPEKEPSGDEIVSDEDLYNTVFSQQT